MSPIRMSKLETAMRVVLDFNKAFNQYDIESMRKLISEDCIIEEISPAPDGTMYSGKEAITRFWQDFFSEMTEVQMKIEEIFGYGERCIMRWRCEWEDTAGKKGRMRGVDLFQVKDGMICEQLSYAKGQDRHG